MSVLEQIEASGGAALAQRLLHLDATPLPGGHPGRLPQLRGAAAQVPLDYDVALLGGGLSLLVASLLAQRGLRVAVFDRAQVGVAHREWNASWQELLQLCAVGFCNTVELQSLVLAQYDRGICRWHGGRTTEVRGVLDCAVDAGALLQLARRKAIEAGVSLFDGAHAGLAAAGPCCVQVRCDWELQTHGSAPASAEGGPGGAPSMRGRKAGGAQPNRELVHAGVVLDGRGARSPYAHTDLVCPTVGGVLEGLEEGPGPDCIDPRVGEILVSTEDVEEGRQHLWEAFPNRPGQTAVYLFYYARREQVQAGALQALYGRFFARLPQYKRGRARLVRPTFGFIPGWSRLSPGPRSPHRRVMLLGDAAARHSPLTFCGFGAMLRSLAPVVQAVEATLRDSNRPSLAAAVDDRPVHAGTGALAMLMARADELEQPAALNRLLDVAFWTLQEMGQEAYASLLKDRMDLRSFVGFLRRVSEQSPQVYRQVWSTLGPTTMARWGLRLGTGVLR